MYLCSLSEPLLLSSGATESCISINTLDSQHYGLTGVAEDSTHTKGEAEDTPQEVNSLLKINKNGQKEERVKNKWHFHFPAGLPVEMRLG
ncbi:hypothetical protein F2P79_011135 [Pimephales promelas]|nr:hypothetical protein F2P79_011135 [Pimephales promelas]